MSPVTIIALTSVVIFFLFALLLLCGALLYLYIRSHKYIEGFKKDLSDVIVQLKEANASNHKELVESMKKINGDDLQKAVTLLVEKVGEMKKFVGRAEMAALAIGDMCKLIVDTETPNRSNVGPEEYAKTEPGEGSYISQSKAAALDAEAAQDM